jgi:hypothetical protein
VIWRVAPNCQRQKWLWLSGVIGGTGGTGGTGITGETGIIGIIGATGITGGNSATGNISHHASGVGMFLNLITMLKPDQKS